MNRKLICKTDIVDAVKGYNANQIKLFYYMISTFKDSVTFNQCETEEEFEIYLQDIRDITKDSKLTQKRIHELIETMPNEIKFLNKDKFIRVAVFEYIEYNFEYGTLIFKVTNTFAEILLQVLEKYTIIQLQEITQLASKHSVRLYELMRRYINQGNYLMKLEEFKKYFSVPGSYKMCNIDYKILKPASQEIKEKLGIECKYTKKKKGREVTHILFSFKEVK